MFLGLVLSLMEEGFGPKVDCSVYLKDSCNTSESLRITKYPSVSFMLSYFSIRSDISYSHITWVSHSRFTLCYGISHKDASG